MPKWDGLPASLNNWRYDPFDDADDYLTIVVWETLDVFGVRHRVSSEDFGYTIQAQEAIFQLNAPPAASVTLEYATLPGGPWTAATEVFGTPTLIGQFLVDYKYQTGLILFHSSMNNKYIRLKYTKMGHVVDAVVLNRVLEQDEQYGHLWMHFDEDSMSAINVPYNTGVQFVFYEDDPPPTNEPKGKYAHWPLIKAELFGGGTINSWADVQIRPLWGGCTGAPATTFFYFGGLLIWNADGGWLGGHNYYVKVYYHGEL
tara:strand:- start:80 stop:853 length:774 start_codon:yes stop_codon:yes gene_type:complete